MILKLKSGAVTIVTANWSAGAQEGGQVFITAHGGTTGLTIDMPKFVEMLAAHEHSLDICDLCEEPAVTMAKLRGAPAPSAG